MCLRLCSAAPRIRMALDVEVVSAGTAVLPAAKCSVAQSRIQNCMDDVRTGEARLVATAPVTDVLYLSDPYDVPSILRSTRLDSVARRARCACLDPALVRMARAARRRSPHLPQVWL